MRTNIEINDSLLKEAMELSRLATKKETVNIALAELIRSIKRRKILDMEGNAPWDGNLREMREL